jgi:hypothetical protein
MRANSLISGLHYQGKSAEVNMPPISLLAIQKVSALFTNGNAYQQALARIGLAAQTSIPQMSASQIVASSAAPELADRNIQLSYPRICLYTSTIQNKQTEKFASFSGTVAITAEIWASANLLTQVDQWIHYYVESAAELLSANIGDWGDGFFFGGKYDAQFQAPKPGGLGFVESCKVSLTLNVSLS